MHHGSSPTIAVTPQVESVETSWGDVALVRSQHMNLMNGLQPFESTIEQTTESEKF